MRYLSAILLIATLALFEAACSGGGGVDDPPAQSDISAVMHQDTIRVYAGPGSADPGTEVTSSTGVDDKSVAAVDGSIQFDIVGAVLPQTQPYQLTLSYTKDATAMELSVTVAQQSSVVTTPLFSTGSAPNDIRFGNDSLYVANSLDNTVVRYGVDGTALATAGFAEYSSPSYLGLTGDVLWALCNGDNQLVGLDAADLTESVTAVNLANNFAALPAFAGPGSPACDGLSIYVPLSMIVSFGDLSVYGTATVLNYDAGATTPELTTAQTLTGHNGQSAVFNPATGDLLVTSAGEIQFDEFWSPYVTTDSYLDIYATDGGHTAINLGQVGAGAIAVTPDGQTAYIGNALTGDLFQVDLASGTPADDPIELTTEFTYVSDVTITPDGKYVLATSYNTDELYVINAATGEVNPGPYPAPFDLSLDDSLLAGTLGVVVDPSADAVSGRYTAYVLYGIANAVAEVQLF